MQDCSIDKEKPEPAKDEELRTCRTSTSDIVVGVDITTYRGKMTQTEQQDKKDYNNDVKEE